jgi:hypothetical protein
MRVMKHGGLLHLDSFTCSSITIASGEFIY